MKPTSLSPEFYTNLYKKIINYGFEPETEDDCYCNMLFEDYDNITVTLDATFEVKFCDDSFDHAFGTQHECHLETGRLEDVEAVTITDIDGNDLSDLFDYDAFKRCMKR
jgi:hypothetical protein